MENASKALLIAGSILVAIVLIALGMKLFNSTSGQQDEVETVMSATEIATFNSQFSGYLGTNKSRDKVEALVDKVIANNKTNPTKEVKLYVKGTLITNHVIAINRLDVLGKTSFEVTVTQYTTTGLVSRIDIK